MHAENGFEIIFFRPILILVTRNLLVFMFSKDEAKFCFIEITFCGGIRFVIIGGYFKHFKVSNTLSRFSCHLNHNYRS